MDNQKEAGVEATIILNWILKKYDRRAWTEFIWLALVGYPD
jgi:hypothetical protein